MTDTIQVSRAEYEALQAELAEAIRQRDKFYGEANLERENAATYRTVLEMCVAATTEEIPFGDLPGMVEALQKAAGQYYRVMDLLRDSMHMKHGLCEPRERRACTRCNATDNLAAMVSEYRGAPLRAAINMPANGEGEGLRRMAEGEK